MSTDYSLYRELITQLLQGEEALPSLPNITFQIRTAISDDNTSINQLEKLVIKDPALSALLMKHASSVLYRRSRPPQTVADAIAIVGMEQLNSIVLAHSLKSLFTLYSPSYKRIFVEAWRRLVMKAATTAVLAVQTRHISVEHAILASLLSEVGSLVMLSVFRNDIEPPDPEHYARLCKEFSKSLGVILLKNWRVGEEYVQVIRQAGDWQVNNLPRLDMTDLVNLSLYHSIMERDPGARLPALVDLPAYKKLHMPFGRVNSRGRLCVIDEHEEDIMDVARTLRS